MTGQASNLLAVIGAGPAGLMAAITAAAAGRRVAVFERQTRPGLKLLATGGGRCNLTNVLEPAALMARFGRQGRFMQPALGELDSPGLRRFFERLGVPVHCADGFHFFPVAESAGAVLEALLGECRRLGVQLHSGAPVEALVTDASGALCGVRTRGAGVTPVRGAVLAAGGCSYPDLGSDGSGFGLARALGHTVTPPVPALVPLVTAESWPGSCAGITFPMIEARIDLPKCRKMVWTGALLFTHRGVSGPAVLDASGEVAALLAAGAASVPLRLNLFPGVPAEEWRRRLAGWRRDQGAKLARNVLAQAVQGSLADVLARLAELGETQAARLSRPQEDRLVDLLTALPLTVTVTEGFRKAMVTRGGVSLKEIDPQTLASRKVPGLFFAGEVVDLDGPCGGFNLQWAFSSGRLAGLAASRFIYG